MDNLQSLFTLQKRVGIVSKLLKDHLVWEAFLNNFKASYCCEILVSFIIRSTFSHRATGF